MTHCGRARRLLERAFDGTLTLDESLELEGHTRACAACAERERATRALGEALLALPAAPVERLDVERSLGELRRRLARPASEVPALPARRGRRRATSVAAAAALVLALGVLTLQLAPESEDERERPAVGDLAGKSGPVDPGDPGDRGDSAEPVEDVLGAVRAALATAFAALDPAPAVGTHEDSQGEVLACATRFEGSVHALRARGFGIERIVERQLADPDERVARAAARYLGAVRDRTALRSIAALLAREGCKDAAARALLDLGEAGWHELRAAAWDPAVADLALGGATRLSTAACLEWLRLALAERPAAQAARETTDAVATRMLELAASRGEEGARALLRWAGDARLAHLGRGLVLDAFAEAPAASELVARALRASVPGVDEELVLGAIERLAPPEAFEWVLRRCRWPRLCPAALCALASFPGSAPALALLDLRDADANGEEAWLAAWTQLVERDPGRLVELARELVATGDRAQAARLLDALILAERPPLVPALLDLASGILLADRDRERALLAVAELGRAEHTPHLRLFLENLRPGDARLAATCVFAAYSCAGPAGVDRVLASASAAERAAVLAILTRPGASSSTSPTRVRLTSFLQRVLHGLDTPHRSS